MATVNIGLGNLVSTNRILAVTHPDSSPIKRRIREARDEGKLIDATHGRRTRSVIFLDTGHLVLSPVNVDTMQGRFEE